MNNECVCKTPNPLNCLRVLAIMLIFMLHLSAYDGYFTNPDRIFIFSTPAWSGCWILFILSGFLAGKGFFDGRYTLSKHSITHYYWLKIKRVYIPAVCFLILILCAISMPQLITNSSNTVIKVITLTYTGNGAGPEGVLWFACTIMWLYIFTPGIIFIIQKISKNKTIYPILLAICIIALCCAYRTYLMNTDSSWGSWQNMYVSPIVNLDLYVAGITLAYIIPKITISDAIIKKLKVLSVILLFVLITYNCYRYYLDLADPIYRYIFPTLYIPVTALYITAFSIKPHEYKKIISFKEIKKSPLLFIDWFSNISFEFYLFHAIIIAEITTLLDHTSDLTTHLMLATIIFVLTVGISTIYHKGTNFTKQK